MTCMRNCPDHPELTREYQVLIQTGYGSIVTIHTGTDLETAQMSAQGLPGAAIYTRLHHATAWEEITTKDDTK